MMVQYSFCTHLVLKNVYTLQKLLHLVITTSNVLFFVVVGVEISNLTKLNLIFYVKHEHFKLKQHIITYSNVKF